MYIANNQGLELLKLLTKIKGEGGINRGENICTQRKKMQQTLVPHRPKTKNKTTSYAIESNLPIAELISVNL